jgi:hypothetical protein
VKLKFYEMVETAESNGVHMTYDAENEAYRVEDPLSAWYLGQLIGSEYSGRDDDEPLYHQVWVHNNYLYIKPV